MKHKERMRLGSIDAAPIAGENNDEETSWLITSQYVEEVEESRYYAYQIVYAYINKSILTPEQKLTAVKMMLVQHSDISRRMMRSMKKSEIKMLSLTKFTAAIDVGIWSNNEDYRNPILYYKDYENLMKEPRVYYSYYEPNIQQFLDLEYLNQVFPSKYFREDKMSSIMGGKKITINLDSDGYTAKYVSLHLQDLMITFPTLLVILNRKEEALYCLERCIMICERFTKNTIIGSKEETAMKFLKTKALLTLMTASIYLNDKDMSHADVWKKAHEALNLFTNIHDKEGMAECNFMLGMILRKKPQRINKTDSLRLRKQPKSELNIDNSFESLPKMQKTSSALKSVKEDERSYLQMAKQYFVELKHQYGIARTSLALAIRKLDIGCCNDQDFDEAEKFLHLAITSFNTFKDYQNLISCYLKLGVIKLDQRKFEEAKVFAEKANTLCKTHKENYFFGDCVSLLDRINENLRTLSMNVFVFLKAFPLVDPRDLMHIGPITQKHNTFKRNVLQNIKSENKVIQVKFDVLTRENLQTIK